MSKKNDVQETIGRSLERLEKLVAWFDEQEEVMVEEGLEKVKEGAVLVKALRAKLKTAENEFKELKAELEEA